MEKGRLKHIFFWFAYLLFEIYTEYVWMVSVFNNKPQWEVFKMAFIPETALLFLAKLPLVYISFYFIKKYTITVPNKILLIAILIFLLFLFSIINFILFKNVFVPFVYSNLKEFISTDFQLFINSFMDKIFILGVAIALKQYSLSQKLIHREQLLMKEKIEAELNFLKSQINPHFLFNTLNNIYSLARKKSDKTPDVVLKLSKLLRFVLYETQNNKIIISREIQFLNDYIELEKIRYDHRLEIKFESVVDNYDEEIAPLLLIPLVENAFKHGASETTSNAFIFIHLTLSKNKLTFIIENSFEKNHSQAQTNLGIGLRNLRRQLEILYPNFELISMNKNSIFKTILKLDLN